MVIQVNNKSNKSSTHSVGKNIAESIREIQRLHKVDQPLHVTVDISPKTFLTLLGIIIAIFFIIKLAPIFILLFIAYAISTVLGRSVRKWVDRGLPMWLSIVIVYSISLILFGTLIWLIVYPVTNELAKVSQMNQYFVNQLNVLNKFGLTVFKDHWTDVKSMLLSKVQNLELFTNAGIQTLQNVVKVFTSFAFLLTSFIISIYIIIDHDTFIDMLLLQITNSEKKKAVTNLINNVEEKLYQWVRGQGILSTIIGFLVWLLLTVLGIPLALPLALFAGLMESIPSLGPVLASVPAIFLAWTVRSPWIGILTVLGFLIIQQIENNFIVPRIMSNVIGVKPIVVIIGVLIGFQVGGIIGALIAVPVLVLLKLVLSFYSDLQKLKAKGLV